MKTVMVRKADGSIEPFDPYKLEASLLHSGASPKITDEIVSTIVSGIHPNTSTSAIYKKAFSILKTKERTTAARYSLKKAITELGPSGFPFEIFLAKVYNKRGYRTRVGVTVQGKCIPHEVDVMAVKGDELLLIEAKFHNDDSLKSDSKIAMYVKSRYEDLTGIDIQFSEEKTLQLTEGILVTNTKFSTGAVQFAECSGLHLIGWNYPNKENLQEMIEQSGLHPLTCLTTLSGSQKRLLTDIGAVLLRDIIDEPNLLSKVGMSNKEKEETINEARNVLSSSTS